MSDVSTMFSSIEEEHKDLAKLVKAAKSGRWGKVWDIIGCPDNEKKSYLLNCVPENRRWTVLQQAVWWNNSIAVSKLLHFSGIDTYGKAKKGKSEIGDDGGLTAFEIAEKFGYKEVSDLLRKFVGEKKIQEVDTFQLNGQVAEIQGFGLFGLAIAAYKNTFHPNAIDSSKPLSVILKDIFHEMNTTDRWKLIRDKLSESVFLSCEEYSEEIQKSESREEFYRTIVNVYTNEETRLYTRVNTALRRQKVNGYKPTADDLALGPYVLVYQMLLMYWQKLKKESSKTYRKMMLTKSDQKKYQKGLKFVWLSFVSSSVNPTKALPFPTEEFDEESKHSTIFEFDNTCDCQWQPRNIEEFAVYKEEERVYPAGSQFLITNRKVKDGETHVYLKLLA
ncbi:uncharacterized protein LOC125674623 [Ostrea edulis]|uniref:uncharacterized protein LOC125674623 n=1 Tax=Ostrea edulis TaxID=37623 RepID=UPI0024AF0AEF|nr:uncharacterized protein LOC125674623 [Ostrea edulis]XP_056013658.1 uncharacterized protein LOC125674623 [Ostrea edulis]